MAKRFTDTAKWSKMWFRQLCPELKLAWLYLCDNCDHTGIWDIDLETLKLQTGLSLTIQNLIEGLSGKVHVFDNSAKLWIISFFEFQYGSSPSTFKAKESAFKRLQKYNLIDDAGNSLVTVTEQLGNCPRTPQVQVYVYSDSVFKENKADLISKVNINPDEYLKDCTEEWGQTLKHFGIAKDPKLDEQSLARLIQRHGVDKTRLAIVGYRREAKTKDYDPAQYVNIMRLVNKPDIFEKLVNLGAAVGEDTLSREERERQRQEAIAQARAKREETIARARSNLKPHVSEGANSCDSNS